MRTHSRASNLSRASGSTVFTSSLVVARVHFRVARSVVKCPGWWLALEYRHPKWTCCTSFPLAQTSDDVCTCVKEGVRDCTSNCARVVRASAAACRIGLSKMKVLNMSTGHFREGFGHSGITVNGQRSVDMYMSDTAAHARDAHWCFCNWCARRRT